MRRDHRMYGKERDTRQIDKAQTDNKRDVGSETGRQTQKEKVTDTVIKR